MKPVAFTRAAVRKGFHVLNRVMSGCDLRLIRVATNNVRGVDPFLDVKAILGRPTRPVLFDVGANDGETLEQFLGLFPDADVFAFEPFDACYASLREQYRSRRNVRIERAALGASRTSGALHLYSGNRMNSLLQLADDPQNPMITRFSDTGTQQVTIDTLDGFCRDHGITRVDCLKIDTQGYDLNVLRGGEHLLREHRIRCIIVELNFVPMYEGQASFPAIHSHLCSNGYSLVDFYNHMRFGHSISWCDACYVTATDK